MPLFVATLLGLSGLAFVLYPLWRIGTRDLSQAQGTREGQPSMPSAEDKQIEQEQAARNALQEVELDYQLGNLAETDYSTLHERYMKRVLVALKSRHDHEQEIDEAIEEELRRLRKQEQDADTAE